MSKFTGLDLGRRRRGLGSVAGVWWSRDRGLGFGFVGLSFVCF